ncbi:hypothetical protein ACP70R_026949 [Stipagrostis hirtigluma subsp. patula]
MAIEAKRARTESTPPPSATSAAAAASVFDSDDLLREILLRLGFTTCLLRASFVCKRWLRHASDPAFLRCFRERHPPTLLGFYLKEFLPLRPHFVPVSEAPELAVVVRRATLLEGSFVIRNCRNGHLLVKNLGAMATADQHAVLSPLHPERGMAVLPPPPRPSFRWFLLPQNGGEDGVLALEVRHIGRKIRAEVLSLQSGVWASRMKATVEPPITISIIGDVLPPVDGKMYMETSLGYILRLDLAAASFSFIKLPDRVKTVNFKISCGDESGVFLIHAEDFMLSVWQHKKDDTGALDWVLMDDAILVHEAYNRMEAVLVVGVDENAEFVLLGLEKSGVLICLNLRSRIERVHNQRFRNLGLVSIFPFMMTWPPIFPAVREENPEE